MTKSSLEPWENIGSLITDCQGQSETVYNNRYFQTRMAFNPGREKIWRILCDYLQRYIPIEASVLDLGAGYCPFINNIGACRKYALDIFPEFVQYAHPNVETFVGRSSDLAMFSSHTLDVIFASNLLEHLKREEVVDTLAEVRRTLKPLGRFIVFQPNYYYCYRNYFDDYTHLQVFTHETLKDLLLARRFEIEKIEARFFPLTFKSQFPAWPWLARIYLKLPYRPFGQQMLIVSQATL